MELTPLKAGDHAEGFGSVVRLVDGFGLRYEDPHPGGPPPRELYIAGGSVTRLHLVDGDALLGRHCTVSGRWTGTALEVDAVGRMPHRVRHAATWVEPRADRPPLPSISAADAKVIARAWARLRETGVVLSRAVDAYGYAHVVTHDLERAGAALRPLYGDSLLLTASPWPPEVFDRIAELIDVGDDQGVGYMTGGGFGFDGEYDRYFGVTYVTDELVTIARDIPDGALRIEALIRPTPSTSTSPEEEYSQ